VLGVYLIGSSFAPFFGTFLSASAGYDVLGYVLAGMTLVLAVPLILISRLSVRIDREAAGNPPTNINKAVIV
jgi:DHA1 family inner membrane transport protein